MHGLVAAEVLACQIVTVRSGTDSPARFNIRPVTSIFLPAQTLDPVHGGQVGLRDRVCPHGKYDPESGSGVRCLFSLACIRLCLVC